MPELPELESLRRGLEQRAAGALVERCELASVSALKTYDPPLSMLVGRRAGPAGRRGKYLCLPFERRVADDGTQSLLWLVIHLARGGWLRWYQELPKARARPGRGPLALRLGFEGGCGFDLTEMGTQKRLAVWVVADPELVPPVAGLGPDPLSSRFDVSALAALLAGEGATLKTVLTDQRRIAGIGNAYSDEILHAAKLSPFRPAGRLTATEVDRLHQAVVSVLEAAVERSGALERGGAQG